MSEEIRNLEPQSVWGHFADLNSVPRPSKKEEKVQAFMIDFAKSQGLEWKQDEIGNILVSKPASAGMEDRKKVVLQAHLDMVCQKNKDTDFDFKTQGINMYIDGEWVKARGTTLGADNGIGVASIMAVLASKDIAHPALEALFTTDEEAGMTGAHHLQAGFLSGDILMNLDTEDDDELSIGCAGGIDTDVDWTYEEEATDAASEQAFQVKVEGLFGGHSGMDIIYGRGNANKVLNRMIYDPQEEYGWSISEFEGGGLRNAIPREAEAIVVVSKDKASEAEEYWKELGAALVKEFATTDPNIRIAVDKVDLPAQKMTATDFQRFSAALQCTHDGIRRMSPDVEDLVETSNNVAHVSLAQGKMNLKALQRSDRESAKFDIADSVGAPWRILGAKVEHSGSYPGWKLDPNSRMLGMMKDLYVELFKEEPNVLACHAGLECGLLGQHYPNLEMISFGPTIKNPHCPDEKVNIASVGKFWGYFLEALKRVPKS
ncbi:aminoacyl-histidine dipeptidase [Croceimicrobium hydrocarbonivorans]|uniref:Cytosol non-specific dipeptidase n=1 Tax=Croceimicrobium hydrocarbonivorans TaxID=2761580 RepID=A0A7H0VEU1_9FLAO|nr:aminoacyl-histidine dipeptidase [Croceimicrobium hydrocarbonivorans]QNR24239.1 aminoacyl-histidine dipeptidase [Croceimicrobium hydrocarbonivorans]